jgi:predicted  nucleic acid-binding Zn-ribbon protein
VVNSPLSERLGRLFRLQDLDIMIREMQDPAFQKTQEQMGFRLQALEKLQTARERLAETIDKPDLRLYDRIAKKHDHGIVPVAERICLGCYMTLPTSAGRVSSQPEHLLTCENCGRILYWLE